MRSRRGLSEIVGALMLVLIVVGAATALSLFVASYQKQLEAEQTLTQNRGLEKIDVLRASSTLNASAPSSGALLTVNLTLASLNVNPATVIEVMLDNQVVRNYSAWRLNLTTGQFETVTVAAGGQFALAPREQLNLLVDVSQGPGSSFYDPSFSLRDTDYLQVDLITGYENDFRAVFLPPTAIALVSLVQTWNGTALVSTALLDGSHSFQSGNGTLVRWAWSVAPDNTTALGEDATPTFTTKGLHAITLTVTNSFGLVATDELTYTT